MSEKKTAEKNARIVALIYRLPSRHSIKRQGSDWQYFDERNRLVSGAGSLWELLEMEFGESEDEEQRKREGGNC